jgi:ATP-dependent Clp protease protease subunit
MDPVIPTFSTPRAATMERMTAAPPAHLHDAVYERLLGERIIFLGSQVDDEIGNRLAAQMLLLSAEDPGRDIHLYVNSPGGSITAGMCAPALPVSGMRCRTRAS